MNQYRHPDAVIVGTEGQMFNQGAQIEANIDFEDYGVFTNDNTYSITFNPYYNRPKIKVIQQETVKRPKMGQRITKPSIEPPCSITENGMILRNDFVKEAPVLPPYLNKPLKEPIQGSSKEQDKGPINYS